MSYFFFKPKSLVDQCLPSVIYGYKLIDLSIFKKICFIPCVCVCEYPRLALDFLCC